MDLGISVQPPDGGEQLPFRHEGRQVDLFGADPHVRAGLLLGGDVDVGGFVLTHQHRGQARLHAVVHEGHDPLRDLGSDLAGDGPAVDEGRRHGGNPTGASQSETGDQLGQCRKCRRPVTTTAMPRASAAASTSSSRTDPPGWITAVTPAWAATSRASGNGKNASVAPSLANTMAFDFTWAATVQAIARSRHSAALGSRAETTSIRSRVSFATSLS